MEFIASADALAADGPRDVGLVFVGDSFVAGYGDPKALGWVNRVVARTTHPDLDLTAYNLGIRGQSSADLLNRWRSEGMPRWAERRERRLVVGIGQADLDQDLTIARSRLNIANMLDDATARGISTFVVGPPPTLDPEFNRRLESLVEAQSDVCGRRSVPYVDCYYPPPRARPVAPGVGCLLGPAPSRPGRLWAARLAGAARRLGALAADRALRRLAWRRGRGDAGRRDGRRTPGVRRGNPDLPAEDLVGDGVAGRR
jgi:acyl-CoA thioesterase-1